MCVVCDDDSLQINHIRNCVSHRDVHHAEEMINDMLHTFSWALLLQTVTYVATACVLGTYLGVWNTESGALGVLLLHGCVPRATPVVSV